MAKDMKTFIRDLTKGVQGSFSKKQMKSYGDLAVSLIVERTRQGYGVRRTGVSKQRLKPLSPSYIAQRRKVNLDGTTSASRSNLTYTGQLLRSMRVKDYGNNYVIFGPNKRARKGGITNEKLGEIVSENGRPFNFLSKEDIAKMAKIIDKALQKNLKGL